MPPLETLPPRDPSGGVVYLRIVLSPVSYNLTSIINFPMRIRNTSATAVDNIFIAVSQLESYTATAIINDVSDHDVVIKN